LIEVAFSFDCWLGLDLYSVSVAVHSEDGRSYDWMGGVHFFRVASLILLEGMQTSMRQHQCRRLGTVANVPAMSGIDAK
jgi:hypothetical protein